MNVLLDKQKNPSNSVEELGQEYEIAFTTEPKIKTFQDTVTWTGSYWRKKLKIHTTLGYIFKFKMFHQAASVEIIKLKKEVLPPIVNVFLQQQSPWSKTEL